MIKGTMAKEDLIKEPYKHYAKLVAGLRKSLVLVRLSFSSHQYDKYAFKERGVDKYTVIRTLVFILDSLSDLRGNALLAKKNLASPLKKASRLQVITYDLQYLHKTEKTEQSRERVRIRSDHYIVVNENEVKEKDIESQLVRV